MESNLKKAVIIIEDDEVAFEKIKPIISDDYPNNKQIYSKKNFKNFRKILRTALSISPNEAGEPEKSIKLLFEKLNSYCDEDEEPIYLIDFLLNGENYHDSINGIHFHKLICRELYKNRNVRSFFITNAIGDNLTMVQKYCEKMNDKTICHFRLKPNKWDDISFKEDIIDFIKNAQSEPKTETGQNNEHKKMEDVYKHD